MCRSRLRTQALRHPGSLPCFNLARLRDEAIRQALKVTRGHKGRAAKLLGVHPNTLTRLLAQSSNTVRVGDLSASEIPA